MDYTNKPHDIIIIGAGSCGSYMAHMLSRNGYSVLVIDKKQCQSELICCTGIVSKECFDRYGIDVNCVLKELGSAVITAPNGNSLRIKRDNVQAFTVDRNALNEGFIKEAKRAGASYLWGCSVEDVSYLPDGISVRVISDSCSKALKAKILINAGGYNPKLLKRLSGALYDDFAIGAQVDVSCDGTGETEIYLGNSLAPGFFGWVVPFGEDKARVGLISRSDAHAKTKGFIETLRKSRDINALSDIALRPIPLKPVKKTYGERMLAVGDAAGQVKPTSGGGVYFGLIAAECAITAIDSAFKIGNFGEKQMSLYQTLWQKELNSDIRRGLLARKFYECLSDKQLNTLFSFAKNTKYLEELANDESLTFDWHGNVISALLKKNISDKMIAAVRKPFNIFTSQLKEGSSDD